MGFTHVDSQNNAQDELINSLLLFLCIQNLHLYFLFFLLGFSYSFIFNRFKLQWLFFFFFQIKFDECCRYKLKFQNFQVLFSRSQNCFLKNFYEAVEFVYIHFSLVQRVVHLGFVSWTVTVVFSEPDWPTFPKCFSTPQKMFLLGFKLTKQE